MVNNEKWTIKDTFKYILTIIGWTFFALLIIIGILLVYYYISIKLYENNKINHEPNFSVYTIVSNSMEPNINVHDVVINTKVKDINDIKVGDIITYQSTWNVNAGMTVTHRVVAYSLLDNGERCLITRGDNNDRNDPVCVKKSNIIGKTKYVIPKLGKVQFFLATKIGWLILIFVPAIAIIIYDIYKILHLSKDIKKETKKRKIRKLKYAYKYLLKVKGKSK